MLNADDMDRKKAKVEAQRASRSLMAAESRGGWVFVDPPHLEYDSICRWDLSTGDS